MTTHASPFSRRAKYPALSWALWASPNSCMAVKTAPGRHAPQKSVSGARSAKLVSKIGFKLIPSGPYYTTKPAQFPGLIAK